MPVVRATKRNVVESGDIEDELNLCDLHHKVICSLVEKLLYTEYALFEQLCKFTKDICNSQKFSVVHSVDEVSVTERFITIEPNRWVEPQPSPTSWETATASAARIDAYCVNVNESISGARLRAVGNIFRENRTLISTFFLEDHVTFLPEDLDDFLKNQSKVDFVHVHQFLSKEFFEIESLRQIPGMRMTSCGSTNEDFLRLQGKQIYMKSDFLTASGINGFLKQWKRKERKIESLSVEFNSTSNIRPFETILEGLDANIMWTPDTHLDSTIGVLPLEEVPFVQMECQLYSICRSDNIANPLIVSLKVGRIDILTWSDEPSYILDHLTREQYSAVTNLCSWCLEEFCEHRRRYSAQRIKKAFPNFYSAVMGIVKGVALFYEFQSYARFGDEVSFPVQPMSTDDYIQLLQETEPTTWFTRFMLQVRIALFNR